MLRDMSGEVIVECSHGLPCLMQEIMPYHFEWGKRKREFQLVK
jgi:hypothetical protein